MEGLLWILLPSFVAVASGLLAWFVMQSRMEVALAQQRERLAEARGALDAEKNALQESLDSALRADEVRLHARIELDELARNRDPRVQVTSGAAAGEEHRRSVGDRRRHCMASERASGSVAPLPMTRSFVLPMFTRIPVRNMVSTMLERPYDTKGSVSPVVGSSPTTTPTCR